MECYESVNNAVFAQGPFQVSYERSYLISKKCAKTWIPMGNKLLKVLF